MSDSSKWTDGHGDTPLNRQAEIDSGIHKIENPRWIEFAVPVGTVYKFSYWDHSFVPSE